MPEGGVDVVTLIFVLSAIHPDKMTLALQNISRVRAEINAVIHKEGWDNLLISKYNSISDMGFTF